MKPVAILQHDATHAPGYLLEFLQARGIAWTLRRADDLAATGLDLGDVSGLVLLDSRHSVKDGAPWIVAELALVRRAIERGVPVLGHAFGGHLLAHALGAEVGPAATPNIGWGALHVTPHGRHLFGGAAEVMGFNWHRETFSLPRGATRMAFGRYTLNEGCARGHHVALQCHLELTADMLAEWCCIGRDELMAVDGRCAQPACEMLRRLPQCLPLLRRTAHAVYGHWLDGLRGRSCAA